MPLKTLRIEATFYEQRLHGPYRVQKYGTGQNEEDTNGNCWLSWGHGEEVLSTLENLIRTFYCFQNRRIELKLNKIMVNEDAQKNLFTQQILNNF